MTAGQPSSQAEAEQQSGPQQERGPRDYLGQTVAEWVTLALSVLIVALLAGYLVYQAAREDSQHVRVETQPLLDQVSHQSGGYILPVEVHNPGRRTLVDFTAEITYRGADGNQQRQEIKIDYLAGRARETRYLYFDADPRTLEVNARPLHCGQRRAGAMTPAASRRCRSARTVSPDEPPRAGRGEASTPEVFNKFVEQFVGSMEWTPDGPAQQQVPAGGAGTARRCIAGGGFEHSTIAVFDSASAVF